MVIDVRTKVELGHEVRCGSDWALRGKHQGAGSSAADLARNRSN